MHSLEPAALWLALIVGGWAAVTARVAFGDDPRLVRSGGRALHAAACLLVIAVTAFVAGRRDGVLASSGGAAWVIALRELLAAPDGMVLLVTTFAGLATGVVPRLVRDAPRLERRTAYRRAGLLVAVGALAAIASRAFWGDGVEGAAPVELFDWSGMAFRVLLAAGAGLLAAPIVMTPVPSRAGTRLRLCTIALAMQLLALTSGAWSRYAAVSPAPELDAAGTLADPQWSTGYLLLLVPALLTAASVAALHVRVHHASGRSRTSAVLLLAAAAMIASALAPAIRDWVVGREVRFGMPMSPLHAWEASFAIAVAVVVAGWLKLRAFRAPSAPVRLMRFATAGAVGTLGLAVLALSTEARQLTLAPGATAPLRSMGREWRFASQGTSQEEAPTYDGALVAFEVVSGSGTTIAAAGERIYRDSHGHPAGRVAVPGVVRGLTGDLRFTVRALRGDEVLIRAQFHPLASLAWLMAAFTVIAFAASALRPHPETS